MPVSRYMPLKAGTYRLPSPFGPRDRQMRWGQSPINFNVEVKKKPHAAGDRGTRCGRTGFAAPRKRGSFLHLLVAVFGGRVHRCLLVAAQSISRHNAAALYSDASEQLLAGPR